jgi:hypothetical protein
MRHLRLVNATPDRERIRILNDQCRTALGVYGTRVVQTAGVGNLSAATQSAIREAIETFDAFTPANDPYGEHDFGRVVVHGIRVFWKIDYYDHTLTQHSADAADPTQTTRVLTIMLAEEY